MKSGTVSTMNYWNDSVWCEGGDSAGDSATRDDAIDGGGMVVQVGMIQKVVAYFLLAW